MQTANSTLEASRLRAAAIGEESLQAWSWADWPSRPIGGLSKRLFDLAIASVVLLFIAPMLLVLMVAIRLQDGGSAIYGHPRVGLGGRPFKCLKLRTMVTNSDEVLRRILATDPAAAREWAANRKLAADPRITTLGKFLRRSSLDELPQILNVLRGDMSLVGPRPVVRDELLRYDLAKVHYLKARPGITGLWQVSGRSNTTYGRRIELDKAYVLHWSFLTDLLIVLRTVPALATRSGAV